MRITGWKHEMYGTLQPFCRSGQVGERACLQAAEVRILKFPLDAVTQIKIDKPA